MSDVPNTETYEALYAQLQEVVEQLEAGELPLEDLLHLYERGSQLAAQCQHLLDQADLRVQQLQSSDGIITSISMQIE